MARAVEPAIASDRVDDKLLRRFVTPEGVDLRLHLAEAAERGAAFAIDIVIIVTALLAMTIVLALAGLSTDSYEFIAVIWLLGFFLLRSFYFTLFEIGPRAATPGKRMLGIRVAPRDGGRLRAESVFARNAMREVEVFLPLSFLAAAGPSGVDGWIVTAGFVWSAVFALFPLLNRDRLRPGDIVGGTWVVKAPKRVLRPDLAGEGEKRLSAFRFSEEELDAYGQHELQVLEDVLRAGVADTLRLVAERIRTKIGRAPAPDEDDKAFLEAYYTALRQRLEAKLLFGVRRRDKHDRAAGG
jgi:uncharacterized RDD family membrane protein YckC